MSVEEALFSLGATRVEDSEDSEAIDAEDDLEHLDDSDDFEDLDEAEDAETSYTYESRWDVSDVEVFSDESSYMSLRVAFDDWSPALLQFSVGETLPNDHRVARAVAFTPLAPFWSYGLHEQAPGGVKLWCLAALPSELDEERMVGVLSEVFEQAHRVHKAASESLELPATDSHSPSSASRSVDEVLAEFSRFVGLDAVERQVHDMVASVGVHRARLEAGLPSREFSPHLVFTGNPGTGKTSVARLMAELYRSLGLLSNGHLVEVSRGDLVSRFIGDTEVRTKEWIERAMGGVLFIDEAYSLANRGGHDYGQSVIDVLLVEMENRRGQFAVIAAGYEREMVEFLRSNPGLQSRFDQTIGFRDYTTDELVEIFCRRARSEEYDLGDGVLEAVRWVCERADRGENFANGRFVRRVFDRTRVNQQRRLHATGTLDVASLRLFQAEDVTAPDDIQAKNRPPIGFVRSQIGR